MSEELGRCWFYISYQIRYVVGTEIWEGASGGEGILFNSIWR